MKVAPSLDEVALFLAVADAGGLTGASRTTGASLPTLSRRMAELERALGARLSMSATTPASVTEQKPANEAPLASVV